MEKIKSFFKIFTKQDLLLVCLIILAVMVGVIFGRNQKASSQESPSPSPVISNNFYIIPQSSQQFYPLRDWTVPLPEIFSQSALITDMTGNKVLFSFNSQSKRPIASITKLMTALVVADNVSNFEDVATISKEAISQDGNEGDLVEGEKIKIKDLLASMLVPSSNDAAYALAQYVSQLKNPGQTSVGTFVGLMNNKAVELKLFDTHFASVTGLEDDGNYSTAQNVALLIKTAYENQKIKEYLDKPKYQFYSVDPASEHFLTNTNKLFTALTGIVASKTGYTDGAGQSLDMIYELPNSQKVIIVVLGSLDRFADAQKLIDWVQKAYKF